jgi:hypothetical protein
MNFLCGCRLIGDAIVAKHKRTPAKRKKALTSRKNSKQSTGPRTAKGTAVVKLNAISHGVYSVAPVVTGERVEDWEAHQTGMIAAIAPANSLELEFAERVAVLTWRLRRVVRYEAAVSVVEDPKAETVRPVSGTSRCIPQTRSHEIIHKELDAAKENIQDVCEMRDRYQRLQTASDDEQFDGHEAFNLLFEATGYTPHGDEYAFDMSDDEFLNDVGLPHDWRDKPQSYSGWTAGMVMKGMQSIAEDDGMSAETLLDHAIRESEKARVEYTANVKRLEVELAGLPPVAVVVSPAEVGAIVQRIAFPDQNALDKVMRYENHLSKQLFETLHMLERLQKQRARCRLLDPVTQNAAIEDGSLGNNANL